MIHAFETRWIAGEIGCSACSELGTAMVVLCTPWERVTTLKPELLRHLKLASTEFEFDGWLCGLLSVSSK